MDLNEIVLCEWPGCIADPVVYWIIVNIHYKPWKILNLCQSFVHVSNHFIIPSRALSDKAAAARDSVVSSFFNFLHSGRWLVAASR